MLVTWTVGEPNSPCQALVTSLLSPYTLSFSPNSQICNYRGMNYAHFNSGSKVASWHDIPKLNCLNNIRFHRFLCSSKAVFSLCILDIVLAENIGHELMGVMEESNERTGYTGMGRAKGNL